MAPSLSLTVHTASSSSSSCHDRSLYTVTSLRLRRPPELTCAEIQTGSLLSLFLLKRWKKCSNRLTCSLISRYAAESSANVQEESAGSEPSYGVAGKDALNGEYCMLPEENEDLLNSQQRPGVAVDDNKFLRDAVLTAIFYVLPVVGPSIAFWQWKLILWLVHTVLGDEGRLLELMQVTLTPATNGIVIACLAIAFGTLTSVTITTLRMRQKEIRQCLNKECCELSLLQGTLVAGIGALLPGIPVAKDVGLHLHSLQLLQLYTKRLYAESTSEADSAGLQQQSVPDTELLGILNTLRYCEGGAPRYSISTVRDEAATRIMRLNDFRSDRLASINTGFPPFHWLILALLAASISLCFLIEVDQSEGRFLSERPEDSFRLRLVWTIMIGTFSGLTALCADLNDPFRGSFNVNESAGQLKGLMKVFELEESQIRADAGCVPQLPVTLKQ